MEEQRQQWQQEGAYLSLVELEAGEPCRGCGQSLLDGLGGWAPLNQLTPEQRGEYDRAEKLFRERHGDCRSHRWSLRGHRATHCGYCCPPPPMSDRQAERIAQISSSARVRKEDLDGWDLTLTCGHVVRRTQHRDHDRYTGRVTDCPACGMRRGVVTAQRIVTDLALSPSPLDSRAGWKNRNLCAVPAEHDPSLDLGLVGPARMRRFATWRKVSWSG